MDLAAQLTRIRRFLRDPNSKIYNDSFLISLYNEVQEDLQNKTRILEDVKAIRHPQLFQMTHMYEWEYLYLGANQFYTCFIYNQQSDLVMTAIWEQQENWGIDSDAQIDGSALTHPWESAYATPNHEIPVKFPTNFRAAKFIAWDQEPIDYREKKDIQDRDPSWKKTEGQPFCYYRLDDYSNSFVLYPRPNVQTSWLAGEGGAMWSSDDTVNQETGIPIRRYKTIMSGDAGLAVDIVDSLDSVLLVYEVNTDDLTVTSETSNFPEYLRKYIEYGVLARALNANTPGRVPTLAEYWQQRYDLGIEAIKRFSRLRAKDRDYRLKRTQRTAARRTSLRLPSEYPA